MSLPGHAEIARLEIAAAWDSDRGQAVVAPGSFDEDAALDAIEQRRLEEQAELRDTFEARQRRRQRRFKSSI